MKSWEHGSAPLRLAKLLHDSDSDEEETLAAHYGPPRNFAECALCGSLIFAEDGRSVMEMVDEHLLVCPARQGPEYEEFLYKERD